MGFEPGDLVWYPVGDEFVKYFEEPEPAVVVALDIRVAHVQWYFILQNGEVESVPGEMMKKAEE